jgi:hypothetical protein
LPLKSQKIYIMLMLRFSPLKSMKSLTGASEGAEFLVPRC